MENWKDIAGYKGRYQVSDMGRVKSILFKKELILKHGFNRCGYNYINLSKDKVYVSKTVHRLVALAFISNPENKPQVNHKDGDKNNNSVLNLEWNTSKENNTHSFKTGLNKGQKGIVNKNSKLSEEQVKEIRLIGKTRTLISIAKEFNVGKSSISYILNRDSWQHI